MAVTDMKSNAAIAALDAMWTQVDAIRERESFVPRPPGSFTAQEYRTRYKMTESAVYSHLDKLVHRGALQKLRVYAPDKSGRARPLAVFIPLPPKGKK